MIQRPQTLLLFATAIMYIFLAFAPLWTFTLEPSTLSLNATMSILTTQIGNDAPIVEKSSNIYLLAGCASGVVLSIITIFFFKDRNLQAKLSALNSLIITVFIGLTVFVAIPAAKSLIMSDGDGKFEWGFYLCIPIIICNFIANKWIRKDEELVRSVDRIR